MLTTARLPESILLIGGWGSGKSKAWCETARFYRKTGTPGHFHVLDTDYAALRNLSAYDDWERNVTVYPINEWPDYVESVSRAYKEAGPLDWLVVDMIDPAWQSVRNNYIEEMSGQEVDEWLLQWKTEHPDSKGHPLASAFNLNWDIIYARYNKFVRPIQRWPGHKLACAKGEAIQDRDDQTLKSLAGRFGVKPGGQKHTAHMFHTVLLLQEMAENKWVFSSMKDQERDKVKQSPMDNFVTSYLMKIGGWTT